ncbi:uncharacterized protein [Nicotiana sylvestris]|uniref:uncharacterized protein n=1 Tax=Nicotiana sylvestris TaxID=4096 RepID=UPI00388CCB7B
MSPKKKAGIVQEANATSGVADESLLDIVGAEQTAPVPTPAEGTTIPPSDTPIPPQAPTSGSGIFDGDLRGVIQMLTQLVASQAQRTNVVPSSSSQLGDSTSSRMNRFLQLDPPVFMGANPEEHPQDFIDEMHKTLRVMHATEIEGVDLTAYHLKGVAYSWFGLWEDSREEGSPPARWSEFADAFIDHFMPAETRATHAADFENLKQGSRSVWEYHIEFARLSKYVIHMLPTMQARVRRFVQSLNSLTINEAYTAALNSDMNYGKMVAFSQATENRKLKNKMEKKGRRKARSTGNMASAPPSRSSQQQQWSHFRPSQGDRGSHQRGQSGERFQWQQRSPCPKYGRMQSGVCYLELPVCYGYGMRGNIQRYCRVSRQGADRGTTQPVSPAAATLSSPSPTRGTPAPAGHGVARGGMQGSGGPSRFYAISGRQTAEASLDVVTGILTIQSHDVYELIDPGSTLSYITPFVAMEFGIEPDQLQEPFSVSTPIGKSIIAARAYRGCVVTVCGRDTIADLIELGIVDFDVIMGMDWLY